MATSHLRRDGARPLGAVALLALGVNGIVGVGIFFAPAEVAAIAPGRASVTVFAATALALIPVAIGIGTLGGRFDEDGGPVLYARAAFGERAAYLVGFLAYASALFSTSATIVGLTRAVAPSLGLDGALAQRLVALALTTALTGVCAAGIEISARVWTALTVAKLVPLVALIVAAVVSPRAGGATATAAAHVVEGGAIAGAGWLRAALTATFTYQGFEIVPIVAGQVAGAARLVPRATVASLALAAVLYVALQIACVAAVPDLAHADLPLAAAGAVYGGPALAAALRIGTSVSALGIAFGMVTMTPRYLSALARVSDLGLGLDRESARGVPTRALAATYATVAALVAAGTLSELFTLASVAVITQFALGALALLTLARRGERGLRLRDAWPAPPTLLVAGALLTGATWREGAVAAATLAVGIALRWARSSTRGRRASS